MILRNALPIQSTPSAIGLPLYSMSPRCLPYLLAFCLPILASIHQTRNSIFRLFCELFQANYNVSNRHVQIRGITTHGGQLLWAQCEFPPIELVIYETT